MKKLLLLFLLCTSATALQAQQINLPRIEQMPNLPAPYSMRKWKQVATDYDNFIFDTQQSGQYLPLCSIKTQGTNFPTLQPIYLDTYVGQNGHGQVAEAINILPAIVGASLVGIDKNSYAVKAKDFFNAKNGQNVYLNNYSSGTGNDWWYEVMPNVFFYQMAALYPNADADFATQITTIADIQLNVLRQLGAKTQPWTAPSMNYRAFNLATSKPNATGVSEPETAGSIAWLLHQAYLKTGDKKYLEGAELALDFLQTWSRNPSYEIQLPYGILTAARINAEEGGNYNIEKFLKWTFSAGQGTLRGWGTIVGTWGGYDVSGLVGEANNGGNDYAFVMNGFQHAAALAPVAKYDKRYARALGKWILNLANASRLFYANALPPQNQQTDSYTWSAQYDANSCIPYEAMKETWQSKSPVAMGDAQRNNWAATDLSLYSGSGVGYLAALIDTTNVAGILQIDLNKTDFRGSNDYPCYLYYNPHNEQKTVTLHLPTGTHDIYEAIGESNIATNVTTTANISINPDAAVLVFIYPTGKTSSAKEDNANAALRVYPNPTSGAVYVQTAQGECITSIRIVNIDGSILQQQNFATCMDERLDLTLPQGIYFIQGITARGIVLTQKIVAL